MPQTEIAPVEKEASTIVEFAKNIVIVSDEDRFNAVETGKSYKERVKFIGEYFDENIRKANEIHKDLTGKKKALVDPFKSAIKVLQTSIGTYDNDKAEAQRQIDLKKQQEETDKHNRAIKAAEKRVEGLLEGVQDNQMKIDVLTDQLANGNFTEDEAQIMREQITLLNTAIQNKQEKVEVVVAKVEEKAPVTYVAPPVEVKNWTGTVVNVKALCQAIADGKIGVGAIKTWNMPYLQSLKKNGQDVPGMSFVPDHGKGQRLK